MNADKRFQVEPLSVAGVCRITGKVRTDERGSFERLFCVEELAGVLGNRRLVNIDRSITKNRGIVRGLHIQNAPHAEMKFVQCLKGSVYDVAVDLRENSSTYLMWAAVELKAFDTTMLCIPEGVAHGFQALEDDTTLLYFLTETYHKELQTGVHCQDPTLNISWPLPVKGLSERDAKLPFVRAHPTCNRRGVI